MEERGEDGLHLNKSSFSKTRPRCFAHFTTLALLMSASGLAPAAQVGLVCVRVRACVCVYECMCVCVFVGRL